MTKTLLFGGSGFFGPVILSKDKDIISVGRTKPPEYCQNQHIQIKDLNDNQMSMPLLDNSDNSVSKYKILKITNRFDEHKADFSKDYVKIKELALTDKQLKTIKKWMEEKIQETCVNVNSDSSYCDFAYNWLKE